MSMTKKEVYEALARGEWQRLRRFSIKPQNERHLEEFLIDAFNLGWHGDRWELAPIDLPTEPGAILTPEQARECEERGIDYQVSLKENGDEGWLRRRCGDCNNRHMKFRLPPAPEKRMVPLGPEDVPPGSVFRSGKRDSRSSAWWCVGLVSGGGAWVPENLTNRSGWKYYTFDDMRRFEWEISCDGGKTWKRCEKEET